MMKMSEISVRQIIIVKDKRGNGCPFHNFWTIGEHSYMTFVHKEGTRYHWEDH